MRAEQLRSTNGSFCKRACECCFCFALLVHDTTRVFFPAGRFASRPLPCPATEIARLASSAAESSSIFRRASISSVTMTSNSRAELKSVPLPEPGTGAGPGAAFDFGVVCVRRGGLVWVSLCARMDMGAGVGNSSSVWVAALVQMGVTSFSRRRAAAAASSRSLASLSACSSSILALAFVSSPSVNSSVCADDRSSSLSDLRSYV